MTLLNIQAELAWLRPLIERLVNAVERIAGPLPEVKEMPRMATLADYSYIPDDELGRIQMEQEAFARGNMLVPGSEAFLSAVAHYEKQIINSYGEVDGAALVAQLPWKAQSLNPNDPQT